MNCFPGEGPCPLIKFAKDMFKSFDEASREIVTVPGETTLNPEERKKFLWDLTETLIAETENSKNSHLIKETLGPIKSRYTCNKCGESKTFP